MRLILIAAIADNGVIGAAGAIPWHIREDLRRFKRLTLGHPVVMGRKTFASLGKPLPGRRNLVLTRGPALPGVECFPTLEAALTAAGTGDVFVMGGAEIYRQALPLAQALYLTHVHQTPAGDVRFPEYDPAKWQLVAREEHPGYTFADYVRK